MIVPMTIADTIHIINNFGVTIDLAIPDSWKLNSYPCSTLRIWPHDELSSNVYSVLRRSPVCSPDPSWIKLAHYYMISLLDTVSRNRFHQNGHAPSSQPWDYQAITSLHIDRCSSPPHVHRHSRARTLGWNLSPLLLVSIVSWASLKRQPMDLGQDPRK